MSIPRKVTLVLQYKETTSVPLPLWEGLGEEENCNGISFYVIFDVFAIKPCSKKRKI